MAEVLLLLPKSPEDVFRRATWISTHTEKALRDAGHEVAWLREEDCTPEAVRDRRSPGVLFVGHGLEDEIRGSDDRPLYGGNAASALHGAWLHAIACDAGAELGRRLVQEGASLFVGYDRRLESRWEAEQLDPELGTLVAALVCQVTLELAAGRHDERAVRQAVAGIRDQILIWLQDHDEPHLRLVAFCQTMVNNLRWIRPS